MTETGVLKWGQRELMDQHKHAWADMYTYVVPVEGGRNAASCNVARIKAALIARFPTQSGNGRLRWRSGWFVEHDISNKGNDMFSTVIVTEEWGIAD